MLRSSKAFGLCCGLRNQFGAECIVQKSPSPIDEAARPFNPMRSKEWLRRHFNSCLQPSNVLRGLCSPFHVELSTDLSLPGNGESMASPDVPGGWSRESRRCLSYRGCTRGVRVDLRMLEHFNINLASSVTCGLAVVLGYLFLLTLPSPSPRQADCKPFYTSIVGLGLCVHEVVAVALAKLIGLWISSAGTLFFFTGRISGML